MTKYLVIFKLYPIKNLLK